MDEGSTGSSTITQLTASSVSAVEQDPVYLSDASIGEVVYPSDDDEIPEYEPQEDPFIPDYHPPSPGAQSEEEMPEIPEDEDEDPSEPEEDPIEVEDEDPSEPDEGPIDSDDYDPTTPEDYYIDDEAPVRRADPPAPARPDYPPECPDGPTRWIDMWGREGKRPTVGVLSLPRDAIIRPSDGSGPRYVVMMDDDGGRGIRALPADPSAPPPIQPISPQRESGVGWLVESDDEEQRAPRDRAGPSAAPPTQQRASMEDTPVTFRYSWESLMDQDRRQRRRTESSTDMAGPSRPSGASQQSIDAPGPSHSSAVIGFLASGQTPPMGVISEAYESLMRRLSFLARHIQSFGRQEASVYLRYLDGVTHLYRSGLHDNVEERHWVSAFTCLLPHTSAWRQHLVDPEYAELRAVGIEGWISSCRVFARSQTPRP